METEENRVREVREVSPSLSNRYWITLEEYASRHDFLMIVNRRTKDTCNIPFRHCYNLSTISLSPFAQQQKDNVKSILLLLCELKVLRCINFQCGSIAYFCTTRNRIFTDDATTLINNFLTLIRYIIFSIEAHFAWNSNYLDSLLARSIDRCFIEIYLLQHEWAAVKDERIYDTSNEMTTTMNSDNLTILWPLKCRRRRLFQNWFSPILLMLPFLSIIVLFVVIDRRQIIILNWVIIPNNIANL